jgi:hypothetical protein
MKAGLAAAAAVAVLLAGCGGGSSSGKKDPTAATVSKCLSQAGVRNRISKGGTYGTVAEEVDVPLPKSIGGERASVNFFTSTLAARDYVDKTEAAVERSGLKLGPGELEGRGEVVLHVPRSATNADGKAIRRCAEFPPLK